MLEKRIGVIMYQTSNSKGQELVAQRMVRDFNKLGDNAFLITSTFHDGMEIVPSEGLLKNKGYYFLEDEALHIPVIRVDSHLAKWPPRRIAFTEFVNTLNNIVDDFNLNVLISHSTLWNGPEETAKFVAWRRDMKNLGGYQDPLVYCHMSHFQEPSSQRYSISELTYRTAWNRVSLSKILEAANLVLVVTPFEKKAKMKMGVAPDKCFLYPGGVDHELFLKNAAQDTLEFRKKHNIAPGVQLVTYLGTLEERKNPLAILRIAEMLQDKPYIHFMLAGRGESAYAYEIMEMARKMPNATYLGEIDDRTKALLIKSSYLNILMSKLEALGISQLEFMYAGVPVITSGAGGQSWLVQHGLDGLVVKGPGDVEGAAKAIIHLVEDKSSHRLLSINARDKAAKFTSIHITGELSSAINEQLTRESGLKDIPLELSETLTKPEFVLKSWSCGSSGAIATNRRIFIKQGFISKSVIGIRYRNIRAIEYARRSPWKIPLAGVFLSSLALLAPSLKDLLASSLVTKIDAFLGGVTGALPVTVNEWLTIVLPLLPMAAAGVIFFVKNRVGFQLHGAASGPIYLPGKLKKAVEFIRQMQDNEPTEEVEPAALESLINSR
jgi:D-inositol-3-phosphate glycosyltransferase